ncbi:ATP-dependent Clp protease adaptor ClpS [Trichothermofontia sp.]
MIWFMGFMGLLLLIYLVNAIKFEWDHSEPDPLAQSKQTWRQRRDRAQRILAQGGPQTLAEYLEIFPDACPRCGGRNLYESLTPRRSFITPLLRHRKPKRSWVCTRCGHNNLSQKPVQPVRNLRLVTSPCLSVEAAQAIPEWPWAHPPVLPVYLHNDNATMMEFVVEVLEQVFELPKDLAIQCMIHTHQLGRSFVIALPVENAQEKVAIAHQRSQAKRYPLRFTVESEWISV